MMCRGALQFSLDKVPEEHHFSFIHKVGSVETWISSNTLKLVKSVNQKLMSGRASQKGEEWGACWKTMLFSLQRAAEQWWRIRHLRDPRDQVSTWQRIQSQEKVTANSYLVGLLPWGGRGCTAAEETREDCTSPRGKQRCAWVTEGERHSELVMKKRVSGVVCVWERQRLRGVIVCVVIS